MQNYEENLAARVNGQLQPLMGVSITVKDSNGIAASLYSDDGVTPLAQPLVTDANGYFGFYAANGRYTLTFTGSQIGTKTRSIELYDKDEAPPITQSELAAPSGASKVGYGGANVNLVLGGIEASLDAAELASRPAYLEQHISSFFGRGMLTAETPNVVTEQALVGGFAAGSATLTLSSTSNVVIGSCWTVKHDNGKYGTYFVDSKSGSNIGIRPALRYDCLTAAARIERTWYNRAHPGKFYMRELAQRIAHSTELDAAMPNGRRVLYTNLSSNPTSIEDTLKPVGSALVNYYAADNLGETGGVDSPVRFTFGRTAYVDNITANGDGAETDFFDTQGVASVIVKIAFIARSSTTTFSAKLVDENGVERGKVVFPAGPDQRVLRIYTFPATLRGANKVKAVISTEAYGSPGQYFSVAQIDVFESPALASPIITKRRAKIVCLGDSWMQGDLGNTAEREPITQQLALELPYATIINAGIGGNKVWQELARFDTDVAPHKPDYVVINTGTNECYSPSSGTFDPNAVTDFIWFYRQLLEKVAAIGARPIIIGVPALAQTDEDVPAFTTWLLNDRAKAYARAFFEWQSTRPFVTSGSNGNGTWSKFADGTMIARASVSVTTTGANTVGAAVWTFPVPFAAAPTVTTAPADYNTNQLICTGCNGTSATATAVKMVSGIGATTISVACVAVGRWR